MTQDNKGMDLTARQKEVLDEFVSLLEQTGAPPTVRELGKECSISSTNAVVGHLVALHRKGWLNPPDEDAGRLCWTLSEFAAKQYLLAVNGSQSSGYVEPWGFSKELGGYVELCCGVPFIRLSVG